MLMDIRRVFIRIITVAQREQRPRDIESEHSNDDGMMAHASHKTGLTQDRRKHTQRYLLHIIRGCIGADMRMFV